MVGAPRAGSPLRMRPFRIRHEFSCGSWFSALGYPDSIGVKSQDLTAKSWITATSPADLSTPTSADLPLARRSCIVPDSSSCRNADTTLCNPHGKLPSAAAPAIPARAEHLPAANLLRDSTLLRLRRL